MEKKFFGSISIISNLYFIEFWNNRECNNDHQRIQMNTMRKRKDADYRSWLMKMALILSAACIYEENRRKCKIYSQPDRLLCNTKVYNLTVQFNCKFHSSLFYWFNPLFIILSKIHNRGKLEILEARDNETKINKILLCV